jgi:hypothetical protein
VNTGRSLLVGVAAGLGHETLYGRNWRIGKLVIG